MAAAADGTRMFETLLNQIKGAIFNSPHTAHNQGNDPDGLIGQIEGFLRNGIGGGGGGLPGGQQPPQQGDFGNVRPASEDPYGDPADLEGGGYGQRTGFTPQPDPRQQFPNLRPASEDPLGDPADNEPGGGYGTPTNDPRTQFPNLRPASEDPYGDPADNEPRRY